MSELPFDQMKRLDAEYDEWVKNLSALQLRALDGLRKNLRNLATSRGMSDRGARAWATLKLEELRRQSKQA